MITIAIETEMRAEYRADAAIPDSDPEQDAHEELIADRAAIEAIAAFRARARAIARRHGVEAREIIPEAFEYINDDMWLRTEQARSRHSQVV